MAVFPTPLPTSGQNPLVAPPPGAGVVPIPLGPTPGNADVDLATSSYVTAIMLAGGVTLTTAQQAVLPSLITAASREMLRFMGRDVVARDRVELVTPGGGRPDRGEVPTAKLRGFPVVSVESVMTGRTTAITVRNTATSTNQAAWVSLSATGDAEADDLLYTGLVLTRVASGVKTSTPLSFAEHLTVDALATAINALGNGWTARVTSSGTPDLGLWSSLDLLGAREPKNALGSGAELDVFAAPASSYDIDRPSGILKVFGGCGGGSWGNGWGDGFGDWGYGGHGGYGSTGQYRVKYRAGWETVPEGLAQVCAEGVKLMFERLSVDGSIKSETIGDYSWAAKEIMGNLSDGARGTLMLFKDWKV